jgi:hypothetical protein
MDGINYHIDGNMSVATQIKSINLLIIHHASSHKERERGREG